MSESNTCCFPLDRLPILIIDGVAQYLSNKDVSSCCAVSRGMRVAFDIDRVWAPRYNKERVQYLLKTACKVEPGFVYPKVDCSSLPSISECRIAFMAENHLFNNWRTGKLKQEVIKSNQEAPSHLGRQPYPLYHEFFSNDHVIAGFKNSVEIWDVRNYPATVAIEPITLPATLDNLYTVKLNDKMLLLQRNGVYVCKLNFSTKQWNVEHTFFTEASERFSEEEQNEVLIVSEGMLDRFIVVSHFLVSWRNGDSVMHIWNYETGVKLKVETCPISNSVLYSLSHSETKLVVATEHKGTNSTNFFFYDLHKLTYMQYTVTAKGQNQYCVFEDCIAIWAEKVLNIYNYMKCKTLLSNYLCEFDFYQVVDNKLFFLQSGELKLFSQSTRAVESLLSPVSWFQVLANKFIQTQTYEMFEIQDTKKFKKILLHLNFRSCVFFLNKYATRYIVPYDACNILHFW